MMGAGGAPALPVGGYADDGVQAGRLRSQLGATPMMDAGGAPALQGGRSSLGGSFSPLRCAKICILADKSKGKAMRGMYKKMTASGFTAKDSLTELI